MPDYTPRFSFEITPEQQARVSRLFSEYGLKRAIMSRLLDELLDMVEEYGAIVYGVILDGGSKPRNVIPSLKKAERMLNKNG